MTPQRDPVEAFVDLAGSHERMFWLDGGGSREWSGRRSILGALREEDVSLTYDASSRSVTRCSPTGFGRSGDRVANTPVSGLRGSLRGCTSSTWRSAR